MLTEIDFTHTIDCVLDKQMASDLDVVNAARISMDDEHPRWVKDNDDGLIGYLMSNKHGSPFEHGFFKFKVSAPIFTFREHHRHRIGHSYNEMSGRYTELEPKFYVPACARVQTGKPGSYVYVDQPEDSAISRRLRFELADAYEDAWASYRHLLNEGVAKEQARMVLPVGIFTKMIWSCNPRSLMAFLELRAESHAQQEIQTVAYAAEEALRKYMPVTYQAFNDNGRIAP